MLRLKVSLDMARSLHRCPLINTLAAMGLMLSAAAAAVAQGEAAVTPTAPPAAAGSVAPQVPVDVNADATSEGRGWLFRSSVLNIGKPEIKAPAVEFNPELAQQAAEQTVNEGRSRFMKPVYRMRDAAKGAVDRTRTAWNGAVERMKFRGDGEAPTMLSRWFGPNEADGASAAPAVAQDSSEVFRR